jgi:hypothetical protein
VIDLHLFCTYYLDLLRCKALSAGKSAKAPTPTAQISPAEQLAGSISSWITTSPPSEPLVFALDHHYTERGLSFDLLKGADRATAELVAAAAEQADCHVYCARFRVTSRTMPMTETGIVAGAIRTLRRGI